MSRPRFVLTSEPTSLLERSVELHTLGIEASARLAAPAEPVGWMVVGAGRDADRPHAAQAARALNRLGLGTLSIDLAGRRDLAALSAGMLAGRSWLATELGGDALIGLGGAGFGGAAAIAAAAGRDDLPLVLAWNAAAELLDRSLEPAIAPTLLLLDRDRPWRERRAQRRVASELGVRAGLSVVRSLSRNADGAVREWYEEALFDRIPRSHTVYAPAVRRVAIGIAAVAAIAVPTAAAGTTSAQAPAASRFASGRTLAAHQLRGDGIRINAVRAVFGAAARAQAVNGRPGKKVKGIQGDGGRANRATGSGAMIDGQGVKYFVNTNITFSTTSSASGAMSEASYTHAVPASTLNGGTTTSTLNDAFDGYQTLATSLNGATGNPETGNANWAIYNKLGPATAPTPCDDGSGSEIVFPTQTVGSFLQVSRKVFVTTIDGQSFARWLDIYTNTGTDPISFTTGTGNNLGSDSNTLIVTSSSGDNVVDTSDTWVTTFQNYSGTTSSDPRLGHILQGPGAPVPVDYVHFANGDDNPYWGYALTLGAGETSIIANYVVVRPDKADAADASAEIVGNPPVGCMSVTERAEVRNFVLAPPGPPPSIKTFDKKAWTGEKIRIRGSNFGFAYHVSFNGVTAPHFTVVSPSEIDVTVPPLAPMGPITVTTPNGMTTSKRIFVPIPEIRPQIKQISPRSGPIGSTVVITGDAFTGAKDVQFHGTPAAHYTVDSDTQITATVAPGTTTGKVYVATLRGADVSNQSFVVEGP